MMREPNELNYDECQVMAIVNLTPDSFYGASRQTTLDAVRDRLYEAISEGATIVDLGGYSSRPGAEDVSLEEEWRRVRMGLEAVSDMEHSVVVSIDTFRAEIVRRAVREFGPIMVNDISAGEMDDDMVGVVAEYGLKYVAMHMRGVPQTMQSLVDYPNGVVRDVVDYFRQRVDVLQSAGIARDAIILDPGFGFAKSLEQSVELLASVKSLCALGYPVLAGVSRKSIIYRRLDITPEQALPGSLAFAWEALRGGCRILRVHDVAATRQVVDLYESYKTYFND